MFGNFSPFKTPSLGWISVPTSFVSLFIFYILSPPFEDNGLPFWVPDVLCQHSEVVLWNLLSVQMFFQWICDGESGLPILFLCHLRTAPPILFLRNFIDFSVHRCEITMSILCYVKLTCKFFHIEKLVIGVTWFFYLFFFFFSFPMWILSPCYSS